MRYSTSLNSHCTVVGFMRGRQIKLIFYIFIKHEIHPNFYLSPWSSGLYTWLPRSSLGFESLRIHNFTLFSFFSNFEGKKGAYSPCLTMSALVHCFTHNSKIILVYVWQGCVEVQNFDLSKGKSSYLELFHVIFILFTITKILYYHQGIFLYIEACVKTKKLKNQNYFKRPSQQLCRGW